ncbi:MAG: hypothetical protein HFJ34_02400 [Clostridia bacterium]|nr:hypothetical protein [Clostridia bacterium]
MKELSKKTKIVSVLIAIIILVGMIILFTKGLNFDLKYQEAQKVQLYLQKEFEIEDIKQITNEVLPNQNVMIQKVEVFEDTISIIAKEITNEQKTSMVNKVNEKYGLDLSADETVITNVPHTRGRDIIKPYILPFIIATVIILAYMAIRYYKLGLVKTLFKTIAILIVAQATLLSVMAIVRIPIGRLTIPLVIAVYLLSLIGMTSYLEKELIEKKKEEE